MAIYQLRITLAGLDPPVWRRILVNGEVPLARLHRLIQAAMGWKDAHQHEFVIDGARYGASSRAFRIERQSERALLQDVVPAEAGRRFLYQYDFADDWKHEVLVEKLYEAKRAPATVPACLAGERACPPEECGGPKAYRELLAAARDGQHAKHAEAAKWVGGRFDPDAFDLAGTHHRVAHKR